MKNGECIIVLICFDERVYFYEPMNIQVFMVIKVFQKSSPSELLAYQSLSESFSGLYLQESSLKYSYVLPFICQVVFSSFLNVPQETDESSF